MSIILNLGCHNLRPTEKLMALFRRLGVKGLHSRDEIDYDAEMAEMKAEMERGLCVLCGFAECRCV